MRFNDIKDISGIGPSLATALGTLGIKYSENLLFNEPHIVGEILDPIDGLTKKRIEQDYFQQALFLRLEHMTEQFADYLVEHNHTFASLAHANTQELRTHFSEDGFVFDEVQLLKWQLEAVLRKDTKTITLKVVDTDGNKIENAEIFVTNPSNSKNLYNEKLHTNEQGIVLIEKMINPVVAITAQHNNFGTTLDIPSATLKQFSELTIQLTKPFTEKDTLINERLDGKQMITRPEFSKKFENRKLLDIEAFYVSGMYETTVRLSSIYKKLLNGNWRVEYMLVEKHLIDDVASLEMETIIKRDGEKFVNTKTKL